MKRDALKSQKRKEKGRGNGKDRGLGKGKAKIIRKGMLKSKNAAYKLHQIVFVET
jgi:hypothetical protein